MADQLTRRQLATALLAAAPAMPQAASPAEDLRQALAEVSETSRRLADFKVPMDTEPAFGFKA